MDQTPRIEIAILLNYWLGWGGGRDFVRKFVISIDSAKVKVTFILLAEVESVFKVNYENISRMPENIQSVVLKTGVDLVIAPRSIDLTVLMDQYSYVGFTCSPPPSELLQTKWIGFIPDMLHARYPSHVGKEESNKRDILFREILESSLVTLAHSSRTTQLLRERYLDSHSSQLVHQIITPFIAVATNESVNLPLPEGSRFFIVSSQNWIHKNIHSVVKAYIKLYKNPQFSDIYLICTGSKEGNWPDDKSPIEATIQKYNMSHRIKFLGHVEKDVQLSLIENSVALISASKNEGGGGAGGIMEASSLGTQVICTATIEHLEWNVGNAIYVPEGSIRSLVLALEIAVERFEKFPRRARKETIFDAWKYIHTEQLVSILQSASLSRRLVATARKEALEQ
jgi:glycosyltransferase involved in cell wall biosynthesis